MNGGGKALVIPFSSDIAREKVTCSINLDHQSYHRYKLEQDLLLLPTLFLNIVIFKMILTNRSFLASFVFASMFKIDLAISLFSTRKQSDASFL